MPMPISGLFELITFLIGMVIILYAIIAFIYRLVKGEAFRTNLKRMLKLLFDGLWGIG